jgi:predicted TIM-barrel fold metal-dependent hydrolase
VLVLGPPLKVRKDGASQIVFGADYPYSTILDHVEALRGCGFTAEELEGIDRKNALRILPQYNA